MHKAFVGPVKRQSREDRERQHIKKGRWKQRCIWAAKVLGMAAMGKGTNAEVFTELSSLLS